MSKPQGSEEIPTIRYFYHYDIAAIN